jgi:hypothetical protein
MGISVGNFLGTFSKTSSLLLRTATVKENETVKYGHEFCGTWTREQLLWLGPEAIVQ